MADWTIIKILKWTESYFNSGLQGHPKAASQPQPPSENTPSCQSDRNASLTQKIDSPRLTAEILLAHTLKIKRLDLYLQHDRPLEKQELAAYKACIKRRKAGEPVAYITGVKGFYESDFHVTEGVLIPRPDTETLVENALSVLGEKEGGSGSKNVLELGVGSGAIIVSLAKSQPGHRYFASDVSLKALGVARKNSLQIAEDPVCFFAGSWFSSLRPDPVFDLIVSNPPYIPTRNIPGLQQEIRFHEPHLALDGGPDGLDCYRTIAAHAHQFLVPGGVLMLEIGFDQQSGIRSLFEGFSQYETIEFVKDLAGHDRVVQIKKID